jgi:hypothetical protein
MIGMRLLGWGMLSAAAYPVVLFGGVHLPAILPQSDSLRTLLWNAHFYLAFVFFALALLHVAAVLFHALVRRDGVFEAMAPVPIHDEAATPIDARSWRTQDRIRPEAATRSEILARIKNALAQRFNGRSPHLDSQATSPILPCLLLKPRIDLHCGRHPCH